MRVLVCGGRDYDDQSHVWSTLGGLHAATPISAVIEGGAYGADTWAMTWGHSERVPVIEFKADWKQHGRSAGPIRNRQMLDEGRPDLVIAFPGGKGTADMVEQARAAGIEVRLASNDPKEG